MRELGDLAGQTVESVAGGRRFLVEHFGGGRYSLAYRAASIRRFVLGGGAKVPVIVAAIAVIISCFLRFRGLFGDRVND